MALSLPIFIHIHKCGGSSLAAVMRRNLRHPAPHLQPSDQIATLKPQELVDSILRAARRDGYVMGHLGYGTHRIFSARCQYFTMLREPKARLVSLWRHAMSTPTAYYHKHARDLSFSAFLGQRSPLELDNGLVRFLSGDPSGENVFINPKAFGTLEESDLQRAIENHEHRLQAFGLVEQFDTSLLLMKPLLGMRTCFYTRRNESSAAVPKPSFPDEAMPLVALDMLLYAEARKIFYRRITAQSSSFQNRISRFRALNHAAQPIFAIGQVMTQFGKALIHRSHL
jgi:hypothetical protein